AKPSVAEIRPVTHLAIAHANQVGQSVARHVCQIDRFHAVGEDEPRALLFVHRWIDAYGGAETVLGQRRTPSEHAVFSNAGVGVAVARQVDEFDVRVVPCKVGKRARRHKGRAVAISYSQNIRTRLLTAGYTPIITRTSTCLPPHSSPYSAPLWMAKAEGETMD